MVGLFNYNPGLVADPNRQQFDPTGAMMGLMAMGNAFGKKPRYTTSLSEATAPDDSGMQTAMGLMNYQRQAQRDKLAQEQLRRQQRLDDLKVDEYQRGVTKEKEWADVAASGDQARMMDVYKRHDPKGWWASQQKDQTPITVAPGATMVDRSGKPIFTAPEKPEPTPEMLRVMKAAGIDPSTPQGQKMLQDRLARWGQGAQVNIDMKQPGEEAKTVGKFFGDQYAAIQGSGMKAATTIGRLNRLEALLAQSPQGWGADKIQEARRMAEQMGIKIGAGAGPGDVARAISSEMAMQMRDPSDGAGLPGSTSDRDLTFLQGAVPGLMQTPEGNKLLIEYRRRIAKRDAEVAKMARDYRLRKGTFDDAFLTELQAWSDKNPLFSDEDMKKAQALSGLPAQQTQAAPQQSEAPQGLPRVTGPADYGQLPAGAEYIDPSGVRRRKGGPASVQVPIR